MAADVIGVILFIAAIPIIYFFLRLGWRLGRGIVGEMRVASTAIPSPSVISAWLDSEWGRPPTVQEVAAVHQMLNDRRNQALLMSGVTLGGIYLIGHH